MEASALSHASHRRGIFSRPTPLLKLQGDAGLVQMSREGNPAAFEVLVARYQSRLLGFCRQMLRSTEDAEDVLQEVFVASYNAMMADNRPIAVRPWLYRIARNRCLNHLRRPVPDGQDTMDMIPMENGDSIHERVQNREAFRDLLKDVGKLPETQRSALLLREVDAMSYEEIAASMETTVPGVKSLLVRARIALAESTQARQLTCDEVKLELAEAAEGLAKAGGPVRRHIRECDGCKDFRDQLRNDSKALAALFPVPFLAFFKGAVLGKLGLGSGGGAAAGGGAATVATGGAAGGAAAGGAAAAGGGATAVGGALATGGAVTVAGGGAAGLGTIGTLGLGAVGTKVGVGLTSAVLLAGAAEVKHQVDRNPAGNARAGIEKKFAAAPTDPTSASIAVTESATATVEPDPKAAAKPEEPAGPAVDPVTGEPITDPAAVPPGTTVPVDPNAPAVATGGVLPGTLHKGKRRKRKVATTDSVKPGTSTGSTGSSAPASSVDATESDPTADPATTDPAASTGGTGIPAP